MPANNQAADDGLVVETFQKINDSLGNKLTKAEAASTYQRQDALGTYARTTGRPVSTYDAGIRATDTDIRAALNTFITNNPGREIVMAPGTYAVTADNGAVTSYNRGIILNTPGTVLDLRGVTLAVKPNSTTNYQLITVSAADCRIIGGRLVGDVGTHTGSTGEWGHGLCITTGADRLLVDGTYITKMWGDGIFVDGGPADVCLRSVVADDNRRQGLSITNAIRPRVEGGAYINTGVTATTEPSAGIDVEPDPDMGHNVTDFYIGGGVIVAGNTGSGLLVNRISGADVTGYADVLAVDNGRDGVQTAESPSGTPGDYFVTIRATARGNTRNGVTNGAVGTRFISTSAVGNERGYDLERPAVLSSPTAERNRFNGFYVAADAPGCILAGPISNANGTTQAGTYPDVDVWATDVTITGGSVSAPASGNRCSYGYVIRPGATGARVIGSDARGGYTDGKYLDLTSSAVAQPVPGA